MECYIELGHTDDVEHKQEHNDNYYHDDLMKYVTGFEKTRLPRTITNI